MSPSSTRAKLKEKWKKCYGWVRTPAAAIVGLTIPLGLILFCGSSSIASVVFDIAGFGDGIVSTDRLGAYIGGPLTASTLVCGICWALTHQKDIFRKDVLDS